MAKIKAELITNMGDDLLVVNSARVSFDKEHEEFCEGKDEKLISYLAKHQHFTPFTHPQITLRETVPIFVARQRFKHVVGFTYNEVSRRYVDDEPEFYTPDSWRSRPDGSVKQGSGSGAVTSIAWNYDPHSGEPTGTAIEEVYEEIVDTCEAAYNNMLASGVAPELARMVLPQSMMTSYYVTGSLSAFARMVKQRKDSHAQKEIQDLANMVDEIIRPLYPVSWEALVDG